MLMQTLEMALLFQIDVRWGAVGIFAPHIMEKTPGAMGFRAVTEMPVLTGVSERPVRIGSADLGDLPYHLPDRQQSSDQAATLTTLRQAGISLVHCS